MGSTGFCGESESQPSTSNSKKFKSPRKLLDECCAVNNAAIPRKLRSAIKKRGLESMTPPLPISKKKNRVYNGVETLRKSGAKKSKLNMKQGHITNDEKEVAETLFLLSNMFYDAIKNGERGLEVHPLETNSSTVLEAGRTMTAPQGSNCFLVVVLSLRDQKKRLTYPILGKQYFSNNGTMASFTPVCVTITGIFFEISSLFDVSHGDSIQFISFLDSLFFIPFYIPRRTDAGKIAARVTFEAIYQTSNLEDSTSQIAQFKSFDDSQLSMLHISKQYPIPFPSGDRSGLITGSRTKMSALTTVPRDREITGDQAAAPGILNCPREEKKNDLLLWPPSFSSTVTQGTEMLESCTRSSINKLPAWFETTNHVIQHLTPEESFTKNKHHLVEVEPMRLRKRCSAHVYISHLIKVMQASDRKEGLPGTPAQLMTSGCVKPGSHINIDNQENLIDYTNGALSSTVSSIQDTILLHKSPFQDQQQASKMSALCSPLKQNSYSMFHDRPSMVATQQLPPFHSSRLGGRVAALFPALYHPARVPTSYLPDWKNGERDSPFLVNNCAEDQSLLPHMHSTPGSKHQQFLQQQFNKTQLPPSLSNVKGHSIHLPSGFDRNGATCFPGNMSQLQIFCNQQHL